MIDHDFTVVSKKMVHDRGPSPSYILPTIHLKLRRLASSYPKRNVVVIIILYNSDGTIHLCYIFFPAFWYNIVPLLSLFPVGVSSLISQPKTHKNHAKLGFSRKNNHFAANSKIQLNPLIFSKWDFSKTFL